MSLVQEPSLFRISPRAQLAINLGAFSGLLLILVACATASILYLRNGVQTVIEDKSKASHLAYSIAITTLQTRRYEKDIFLNVQDTQARSEYIAKWQIVVQELDRQIEEYGQRATTLQERENVRQWQTNLDQYRANMVSLIQSLNNGTLLTPDEANIAITPFKDSIREITDRAANRVEHESFETLQAYDRFASTANWQLWLIMLIGAVALFVSLTWSWFFFNRLVRPIEALKKVALAVGRGKLDQTIPVTNNDDIGDLQRAFNQMVVNLSDQRTALEQRNHEVQQSLQHQQQLFETVKQLSAPLLPLTNGIVVLPIVGYVDTQRAHALTQTLLHGVSQYRARTVILDVTGIAVLDTHVLHLLLQTAAATRLLGAQVLLAGVTSAMAQVIVEQNVDVGGLQTFRDLGAAFHAAQTRLAERSVLSTA